MADPRLEIAAARRRTIVSLLQQKPMTSREVAEIMGLDKSTIHGLVKSLVKNGAIESFGPHNATLYRPVTGAMPSAYQIPLDVLASEMAKAGRH